MSKNIKIIIGLIMISFIISCITACTFAGPYPYGTWHSSDPDITLYIDEDKEIWDGTYVVDGVSIPVIVSFSFGRESFDIMDREKVENPKGYNDSGITYFCGDRKVRGDKMYYYVKRLWAERTSIEEIVFERVED